MSNVTVGAGDGVSSMGGYIPHAHETQLTEGDLTNPSRSNRFSIEHPPAREDVEPPKHPDGQDSKRANVDLDKSVRIHMSPARQTPFSSPKRQIKSTGKDSIHAQSQRDQAPHVDNNGASPLSPFPNGTAGGSSLPPSSHLQSRRTELEPKRDAGAETDQTGNREPLENADKNKEEVSRRISFENKASEQREPAGSQIEIVIHGAVEHDEATPNPRQQFVDQFLPANQVQAGRIFDHFQRNLERAGTKPSAQGYSLSALQAAYELYAFNPSDPDMSPEEARALEERRELSTLEILIKKDVSPDELARLVAESIRRDFLRIYFSGMTVWLSSFGASGLIGWATAKHPFKATHKDDSKSKKDDTAEVNALANWGVLNGTIGVGTEFGKKIVRDGKMDAVYTVPYILDSKGALVPYKDSDVQRKTDADSTVGFFWTHTSLDVARWLKVELPHPLWRFAASAGGAAYSNYVKADAATYRAAKLNPAWLDGSDPAKERICTDSINYLREGPISATLGYAENHIAPGIGIVLMTVVDTAASITPLRRSQTDALSAKDIARGATRVAVRTAEAMAANIGRTLAALPATDSGTLLDLSYNIVTNGLLAKWGQVAAWPDAVEKHLFGDGKSDSKGAQEGVSLANIGSPSPENAAPPNQADPAGWGQRGNASADENV